MKLTAVEEIITICPKCGGEMALWSKQPETTCVFCKFRLYENEKTLH